MEETIFCKKFLLPQPVSVKPESGAAFAARHRGGDFTEGSGVDPKGNSDETKDSDPQVLHSL